MAEDKKTENLPENQEIKMEDLEDVSGGLTLPKTAKTTPRAQSQSEPTSS